ncbi:serine hydrolase domain-containing protein [Amycolatopsis anabasis]|uniref:serine hydrolase domain-containing protein n=1 Tax=Amycolatopsis anabasis TaxID=1840409 RepID=UPI0015D2D253|nr:serine hydrolase domain-containing protein [Amycolatopsis anabasis]
MALSDPALRTAGGFVAPGFESVREAFLRNFRDHGEVGAAVAVYHRGRPVVDLWGGDADPASGRPWNRDTTALWMSSTKGATATVVHLIAERGLLDLDAPVREYWPEFGAEGKDGITAAQVLAHRSGVAVLDPPYLTLDDVVAWRPLAEALAAQRPVWTPGARHGYHAQTFGYLLDEILRRVTGRGVGELFAAEVAEPLGLDFWLGLPADREDAVAPMITHGQGGLPAEDPRLAAMDAALADPGSLLFRSVANPVTAATWDGVNTRAYHAAPLTSANAIGTARSMARHYASLLGEVDGIRSLKPETVAEATRTRSHGPDALIPAVVSGWGLGYAVHSELHPFPAEGCFGHGGAGGSRAFADPGRELAFAYLPNNMIRDYGDPRSGSLVEAVYRALT